VTETLFTVTHSNNTLRVAIPGNIVDTASDDVVFSLCGALTLAVPDAYGTRDITTGYVEAARRETGDGGLGDMVGVLSCNARVVNIAYENGLVGGVGYRLAIRARTKGSRLTSSRRR
jgi:hypothetical protein